MTLLPPDNMIFRYHEKKLDLAWRIWQASNSPIPPSPEEVETVNMQWIDEILRWGDGVRYAGDIEKSGLNR